MVFEKNSADFFMGANSPDGFHSLYAELQQPQKGIRRYLMKGGAGTGKSSLMRRIASEFGDRDELTEYIHCSSDPNSLDGVILHTGKTSIVDATPPHVIEPSYPGGFESVINLCEFFNEEKLESRLDTIVRLQSANAQCHRKCRGMLKCADILMRDNYYYAEDCTDFAKIEALADRICKAELRATGQRGEEHRRLLSAVTNQGIVTYRETPLSLCGRIVLIHDDYGVSANSLLQRIRMEALGKGYEIYSCNCPLSPDEKLEHLFIPSAELGFVTRNKWNDFEGLPIWKTIHYTRFTDCERLKARKRCLAFNRKAATELMDSAIDYLKQAKAIHDQIEEQYADAVDFEKVDRLTEALIQKIASRYDRS